MFKRKMKHSEGPFTFVEELENRRLLSVSAAAHLKHATAASAHHHHHHHVVAASTGTTTTTTTTSSTDDDAGEQSSTTTFSGLQTTDVAAYNELTSLATADSTTIAGTQTVYIRPLNGTTTYYTVVLTPSTGTSIKLTSDENGNPITPPTSSTTTFGAVTDSAATTELTSLASALSLTAPGTSDTVDVRTANGLTTYSVELAPTSGSGDNVRVTVDAAGNPAGHMRIPFSALNSTVSGGLTTLATAKSQTIAATQTVRVNTSGGVTTYTVRLAASGQSFEFTVDTTGAAATPSSGDGFGGGEFGGGFGGGDGGGFGDGGFGGGHRFGGSESGGDGGGNAGGGD